MSSSPSDWKVWFWLTHSSQVMNLNCFLVSFTGELSNYFTIVYWNNVVFTRMVKPRIVLLIFVSGKVVLTGAKVRQEIYEAFDNIYPILKNFKKQWLLSLLSILPSVTTCVVTASGRSRCTNVVKTPPPFNITLCALLWIFGLCNMKYECIKLKTCGIINYRLERTHSGRGHI